MLWILIIVAIVVIALIAWLLVRRKAARTHEVTGRESTRPSQVGRDTDRDRTAAPAAERPFDQHAAHSDTDSAGVESQSRSEVAQDGPDTEVVSSERATVVDADRQDSQIVSSERASVVADHDQDDVPTQAVPVVDAGGHGSERSFSGVQSEQVAERDDVGTTHDGDLVAPADPHELATRDRETYDPVETNDTGPGAGTDAQVARENDDPLPAAADERDEDPAAAARHEDAVLPDTPVDTPAVGRISLAGEEPIAGDGPVVAGTPVSGELPPAGQDAPDPADAALIADPPVTDPGTPADRPAGGTSAGRTAGYAVGRTDAPTGSAGGSGDAMAARFGDGAASPNADGSAPAGFTIKGNADSMLFHTPDSPRYEATDPEVWFRDEATAVSAGFAHWDRAKRGAARTSAAAAGGTTSAAGEPTEPTYPPASTGDAPTTVPATSDSADDLLGDTPAAPVAGSGWADEHGTAQEPGVESPAVDPPADEGEVTVVTTSETVVLVPATGVVDDDEDATVLGDLDRGDAQDRDEQAAPAADLDAGQEPPRAAASAYQPLLTDLDDAPSADAPPRMPEEQAGAGDRLGTRDADAGAYGGPGAPAVIDDEGVVHEADARETGPHPGDGRDEPVAAVTDTEQVFSDRRADSDSTRESAGADSDEAHDDPMREQFGDGARSPREDGSAPSGRHVIKGNADSMLFHTQDSPYYELTEAEVWFTDEDAARAAGFQHWDHRKR